MRLSRGCVAFGLVMTVLAACLTGSASAAFPGQNGKIAFDTITGGGGGVYVIQPDGTGFQQVVPRGEDPAWSADGSRLAYIRGSSFGGLFVASADGSGEALLREVSGEIGVLHEFFDPAWSPDGGTIAYVWVESRCPPREACTPVPHGIRAIAPDGTGDRRLIGAPAGNPAFSPDGTRIAWDVGFAAPDAAIHVSNADGTGDTVLAQSGWEPSWSPDGSRIAFSRAVDGETEIHAMNADGTGVTRLTFLPGSDRTPAWSPDGTKIAWSHGNQLWTMNVDGSAPAQLFPAVGSVFIGLYPDWQPLPLPGPDRSAYRNASHFCKAQREFMGDAPFRQQYGNHGGCVSRSH
jgi:TolB protein